MNNPFWDFSLIQYARDGVSPLCIALQDDYQLDVNVLLYGAWLASMDKSLNGEHLSAMEVIVGPWREQVVQPLRALRRQWRDYPAASTVRDEIKRLELAAEQQQQDMMLDFYRQAPGLPVASSPLRQNLRQVMLFARPGTDGWEPEIRRLARHLDP